MLLLIVCALQVPAISSVTNTRQVLLNADLIGLIFNKATSAGNQEIVKIH
jgi:hypothetical protein